MIKKRITLGAGPGISWILIFIVLMFTASCASVDCDWDVRLRPDPVSLTVTQGVFWGQNYEACFLMNGVLFKEYIPECAYNYYSDRQALMQSGILLPPPGTP